MLPAGHPARALFEAASSTASTPAPAPAAGRLLFDGGTGERPTDSPTIAQLAKDADGHDHLRRAARRGRGGGRRGGVRVVMPMNRLTLLALPLLAGAVTVAGGVRVWLVGAAGRFPPGDVPPGTYTIKAFFDPMSSVDAGSITVEAGGTHTVQCSKAMGLCSVK